MSTTAAKRVLVLAGEPRFFNASFKPNTLYSKVWGKVPEQAHPLRAFHQ